MGIAQPSLHLYVYEVAAGQRLTRGMAMNLSCYASRGPLVRNPTKDDNFFIHLLSFLNPSLLCLRQKPGKVLGLINHFSKLRVSYTNPNTVKSHKTSQQEKTGRRRRTTWWVLRNHPCTYMYTKSLPGRDSLVAWLWIPAAMHPEGPWFEIRPKTTTSSFIFFLS